MQQLTYTAPHELRWLDVPEPALSDDGAALVRPLAVATCDLDALIIAGESPFAPPFAFGHECVAEVVDAGDGVSSFARGQLVSVPFQISCGTCDACLRGRTGNCTSVDFMSSYGFGPAVDRWGGFLSELVLVPYAEHMLVPVPEGLQPAAVASASDNISDAWRAVAPPLSAGAGRAGVDRRRRQLWLDWAVCGVARARARREVGARTSTPTPSAAATPPRWASRRSPSAPQRLGPVPGDRRCQRRPRRPGARAALDRA